jgi:hypothetical protein
LREGIDDTALAREHLRKDDAVGGGGMRPSISSKSLRPSGYARRGNALQPGSARTARGAELLMNMDVVRRPGKRNEELLVSDNRATLCLRREVPAQSAKQNAHPFQIYQVANKDVLSSGLTDGMTPEEQSAYLAGHSFWAVRSGSIEYRPQWINLNNHTIGDFVLEPQDFAAYVNGGANQSDDVGITCPVGKLGFDGYIFALNTTPELDEFGLSLGCYYSFWIEIEDVKPDPLGAQAPTVTIKAQRFRWAPNSAYTPNVFPGNEFRSSAGTLSYSGIDKEIIPIGTIQITPNVGENSVGAAMFPPRGIGNNSAFNEDSPSTRNLVNQIITSGVVRRFDLLGLRLQGDFDPTQHRTYYPGDLVLYDAAGDNTDPSYGYWQCYDTNSNSAGVTTPGSTGAFFYFINPNPPSATNPP